MWSRTLTTAQQRNEDSIKASCRIRKDQVSKLVSGSTKKSSYKEHRVDALAPYAEEGRGKLRKATGSRKQALIRRYPNGGTRQSKRLSPQNEYIVLQEGTRGTETSKYPQEEKINNDFLSSGERTGKRPNQRACFLGLWVDIRHCETLVEEGWKAQPKRVIAP